MYVNVKQELYETVEETYENEMVIPSTINTSYNVFSSDYHHHVTHSLPVSVNEAESDSESNLKSAVPVTVNEDSESDSEASPSRSFPCSRWSWMCAGLVLVTAVACVSMGVAAWSIVKLHSISNSQDSLRGELTTSQQNFVNTSIISAIMSSFSGQLPLFPATSCLQVAPSSPSGYYWVRASNGSAVRVYCDMTRSCGGVTGGWIRVAHLDFNDSSTTCPSGFRESSVDSVTRTCGIESSGPACPAVMFSTSGVEYTKVCGKVLAYQFSSPDAFGSTRSIKENRTIDSNYVDGVSLTHGSGPREHIWTFAAAMDEYGNLQDGDSVCECSHSQRNGRPSPSFVGQDYFCDSGIQREFVSSDHRRPFGNPLWDGTGCGIDSTCCLFNNPPWFHKELPSPTSDDIEMRVCCDESRNDEDIEVLSVEIYVQ